MPTGIQLVILFSFMAVALANSTTLYMNPMKRITSGKKTALVNMTITRRTNKSPMANTEEKKITMETSQRMWMRNKKTATTKPTTQKMATITKVSGG